MRRAPPSPSAGALLAVLVILAGCSAVPGFGPPPSDERAVEARDDAAAYLADAESYRFDLDTRVVARTDDASPTFRVDANGSVSLARRVMGTTASSPDRTLRSYVDGYTAYTECAPPWDGWGVATLSRERAWRTYTPLGRQVALLNRTSVYWRGRATVNGTRTRMIVGHPSARALGEVSREGGAGRVPTAGRVENVTVRLWVDDDGRPVKSTVRVAARADGASGIARLDARYRDFGAPVSVTVPRPTGDDRYELGCPGS